MKKGYLSYSAESSLFQCLTARLDLVRRLYSGALLQKELNSLFELASLSPLVEEMFTKYYVES